MEGRNYILYLQIGFAVALLLVISAFQLRIQMRDTLTYAPTQQEVVTMEEVVQTQQMATPPPPPRPPVPVEVPNDVIIEEDNLNLDATLDISEPLDIPLPPPPAPPETHEEEEDESFEQEVFVAVEQMPQLIGGMEALLADLEYPKMARKAGVEGTVVVSVIIDQEGIPTHPTILKSVADVLDDAAIEAVMMQRFEPGRQRNRPVRVSMSIPVIFRLLKD